MTDKTEIEYIVTETYGWSGGDITFVRTTEGKHFIHHKDGHQVEVSKEVWDARYEREMRLPPITAPMAKHTVW